MALALCQSDPVLDDGLRGNDTTRDAVLEGVRRQLIERVVKDHEVDVEDGSSSD